MKILRFKVKRFSPLISVIFVLLAACSQGGTPASNPPSTPPPAGGGGGGPTWQQGVYEPASQFKDRCQAPRSGVDIEGNAFPDVAGSTLLENFWLRSWTHETYLWNDEVVDRNPANFSNRLDYFAVLRTTAKTASGKDKDQFHFSQPTEEFLRARNSAPRASYGARYVAFSSDIPRDIRIQYTDPGTPASTVVAGKANFIRGARILEVDGVDLVNGSSQAEVDMLNDGLFPAFAGETHTFKVQDPGAAATRTVTITAADLSTKPVNSTKIIDAGTAKVGYILFNTFSPFSSEKEISDAIDAMDAAGVDDLILDLRYNGGGLLAIAGQLGYMVAGGAATNGKVFERLRFNDDAGGVNPVTGETNNSVPFYSTGLGFSVPDGTPLTTLNLSRVFVLSTAQTCSASEAVINGLRGIGIEVILIGETTCGKPFGFYPTDNCGETYYTIQFQGVNNVSFGDYTDGFAAANTNNADGLKIPGCSVRDDYDHELGDESEALLAAALQYRASATCPTPPPPTASSAVTAQSAQPRKPIFVDRRQDIFLTNRDMTMPN